MESQPRTCIAGDGLIAIGEVVMGRPIEMTPEERASLLRQGYKPVEIWVPDIESAAYRKEAARQAKASTEADRQGGIAELTDPTAYDTWDKL